MKLRATITLAVGLGAAVLVSLFDAGAAKAADGEFSIQVYPSPLVATVKPGQATSLNLNIRNNGANPEALSIKPIAFKTDTNGQAIHLTNDIPEVAKWISFSAPTFTVAAGQTATQKVMFAIPQDAGFSYSFALLISRAAPAQQEGGPTLNGAVAVFALINVDRPDAKRSLEITSFRPSSGAYAYLPVTFNVELKNTGNSILQPSGTLFVQRGPADMQPIAALPFNAAGAYILPGASRVFTLQWDKGFQVLTTKTQPDGSTKQELSWNWDHLGDLRIGPYTAKLAVVYSDGQRDIPLLAQTSFWVMPWSVVLLCLGFITLLALGLWSVMRTSMRASKSLRRRM